MSKVTSLDHYRRQKIAWKEAVRMSRDRSATPWRIVRQQLEARRLNPPAR